MMNARNALALLACTCLFAAACDKEPSPSEAPSASAGTKAGDAVASPDAAAAQAKTLAVDVVPTNSDPKQRARAIYPPTRPAVITSSRHHAMRQRWSVASVGGATAAGDLTILDDGTLLVATAEKLHVVAAENGRVISSVALPGRLVDGPRRIGDGLWVLSAGGRLAEYDVHKPTAGPRTELLLAGEQRRLLGVTPTAVVMLRKGAKTGYELAAFKRRSITGKGGKPLAPVWARRPKVATGWQWLVRLAGNRLVLPDARRIVGLDVGTGGVRWMWRTKHQPVPGVLHDGHYELVHGGALVRLDARTGKVSTTVPLGDPPTSEFGASGSRRFYGTKTQTVAVDVASGKVVWSAGVPSAGVPLVGERWVWAFSGNTVHALEQQTGKVTCSWTGYKGTKPTVVGDALAFIESETRTLVAIGCDPAPVVVPPGACRHLQECCGAYAATEPRVGTACANALSRILDLGMTKECRKALITYAKDEKAPAICRRPPPPPKKTAKPKRTAPIAP